jgi:hypothetical protein
MANEMTEEAYKQIRQLTLDEYLREQDQDLERRQLLALRELGRFDDE